VTERVTCGVWDCDWVSVARVGTGGTKSLGTAGTYGVVASD